MLPLLMIVFAPGLPPFQLKDGDRVVWIGSAIAEREQKYGHWETALLCQWPDRRITFRNLGWSGDTVEGIARASFDAPVKGYERLLAAVKAEKPMAIFVSYGSVEALDEKYRDFENKLEKLIEDLAPTRARFVLFAPTPLERDSNNVISRRMQSCARSVGDVAERGGHRFADLHSQLMKHPRRNDYTFTDNGLHFSDAGYEGTIPDFFNTLGLSWSGESPQRYEAVRKAVLKKNELFFNQWRPQNETYLFGFRKREQGQNAKEVEQFNALIAKVESEITTALNAKTN